MRTRSLSIADQIRSFQFHAEGQWTAFISISIFCSAVTLPIDLKGYFLLITTRWIIPTTYEFVLTLESYLPLLADLKAVSRSFWWDGRGVIRVEVHGFCFILKDERRMRLYSQIPTDRVESHESGTIGVRITKVRDHMRNKSLG